MTLTSEPIFVDANIFIYAVGQDLVLKGLCLNILEAIEKQRVIAYTSSEVFQELIHYLRNKPKFATNLRLFLSLPIIILPVGEIEVRYAFSLLVKLSKRSMIDARDAIHVATMKSAKIKTIVSSDKHFDFVKGINRLDPLSFAKYMK